MTEVDHPVLDDHLHLDPRHGEGIEAVERFVRSGGTHLCLVNKPSWTLGVEATEPADFDAVFEETLAVADRARDVVPGDVYPVLGVHPGLISRLVDRMDVADAVALMRGGLDRAAERVEDGPAIALKSGRPHYDVDDDVWQGSNDVMRHAFRLAADRDCAVQLHTESGTDFDGVATVAEEAGMAPDRVVKHYAEPGTTGVRPSLLAREEWIREAAEAGERFTLETDFVDDPERPGAVLGPRTVPRRVRALADEFPDAIRDACVDLPEQIYDVEIALD